MNLNQLANYIIALNGILNKKCINYKGNIPNQEIKWVILRTQVQIRAGVFQARKVLIRIKREMDVRKVHGLDQRTNRIIDKLIYRIIKEYWVRVLNHSKMNKNRNPSRV